MAIITPLLLLLKNYKSVKHVLTPGLVSSMFLSLAFVIYRKFPPICSRVHSLEEEVCKFEWREGEMFMCLMCVVMIKNRSAVSLQQMVETFLLYSKLVNTVLFFRVDPKLGFVYVLLCFIRVWVFPDVFDEEADEVLHLDDKTLQDVLHEDRRVVWIVNFYTTWSPQCHSVSPVFATIAKEYGTDFLKFAKIDVGRYPEAAEKYGVSTSTMSRQLPTLIVFENQKPSDWRPMIGKNKKFIKYSFTDENIIRDFGLNALFAASKKKGKKATESSKKED